MSLPVPGIPGAMFVPLDPEADVAAGREPVLARRVLTEVSTPVPPAVPPPQFTDRSELPRDRLLRRLAAFEEAAKANDGEVDVTELVAIVRAVVDLL